MTFDRAFTLVTYTVAAIGFAVLALTGRGGPVLVAAMAAGWLLSSRKFRRFHPSPRFWSLVTAAFLLSASLLVVALGRPWLDVSLYLVVYLQIHRLFVRASTKDDWYVYLIAFLQVLLGTVLVITPFLALLLVAFLVSSAWGLTLLQVKQGLHAQNSLDEEFSHEPSPQSARGEYIDPGADALVRPAYILGSGAASLFMLLTTILLFLIIPRLQINLFHPAAATRVHVSGFSEEVRLGEVGRILSSHRRVMRVRLEPADMLDSPPYWRGVALDHFDGRVWRVALGYRQRFRTRPPGLVHVDPPAETNLIQRYTVEPLDTGVLFVIPHVLAIEASLPGLMQSYTEAFDSGFQGRKSYVVYSHVESPRPDVLRKDNTAIHPALAGIYLQLPDLNPEVRALARRITLSAATDYDRVRAIRDYLRDNYEYSTVPRSGGNAPLEDFLFRTREGHCEYFASALVVLCRAIGIPARMVNGFLGGEYNSVGHYWVVRQENAHSWAEVRFARSGWVRFDATPAGEAAAHPPARSVADRLGQYLDYAETQWYFFVLDYDLGVQMDVVSRVLQGLRHVAAWDRPGQDSRSAPALKTGRGRVHWFWLGAALLAVVAAWRGWRAWAPGRHGPAVPRSLQQGPGRRFASRRRTLHARLTRAGFAKAPGETPLERAQRAGNAMGDGGLLARVEMRYYAARFGGVLLGEEDLALVERALDWVERRSRSGGVVGSGAVLSNRRSSAPGEEVRGPPSSGGSR